MKFGDIRTIYSSGGGILMKTFLKALVAVGAAVATFVAAPSAMADPPCGDFTPFFHGGLGGYLTGLPEAYSSAYAAKISDHTINSGALNFLCTSVNTPGIVFCSANAGTPNDGNVAFNLQRRTPELQAEWANCRFRASWKVQQIIVDGST